MVGNPEVSQKKRAEEVGKIGIDKSASHQFFRKQSRARFS